MAETNSKLIDINRLKEYDAKIKEWTKELDEPIDQEFTTNNTVGALESGTAITRDMTLAKLITDMLVSVKDATKGSDPSCSMKNTGGTSTGAYEVGTTINTSLSCTYIDGTFNSYKANSNTQTEVINAGCTPTGPSYKKGSAEYSAESFILAKGNNTITGTYAYSASTNKAKKSNQEESSLSIPAGSCNSSLTWRGYYCRFDGKFEDGKLPSTFTRENLTNSGECKTGDITGITMPIRYYVMAIPKEFTISAAVNVNSANASIMGSIMDGYPKTISMRDSGTGTYDYKLYIFDAGAGSGNNKIKITLS